MVNRVLTSPYLWWFDPFSAGLDGATGCPESAGASPYGNDRFIPCAAGRRQPAKRTLAVCADGRAAGPLSAGQAIDCAVIRRAAASGSGLCRPGAGKAHRRFRPLSHRQGHRAVPPGGRELALHPVQPAAADRSRNRASGAERQPRGAVFCRAHRGALCRRAQGQAGDPDTQSVLSGLCRRRPRRGLRGDLSADHARQRIFAGSRCARRRHAGANRRDLHRLAGQSARRGGFKTIFRPAEATRRPLRLHDPERRMLFGNLHQGSARQHAGMRRA